MSDLNFKKPINLKKPVIIDVDDDVRNFFKKHMGELKETTVRLYISKTYASEYSHKAHRSLELINLDDLKSLLSIQEDTKSMRKYLVDLRTVQRVHGDNWARWLSGRFRGTKVRIYPEQFHPSVRYIVILQDGNVIHKR